MAKKGEKTLAAIQSATEQDEQVQEDIKRAIEYQDKAFFEKAIYRVINRYQLTIPNIKAFIDIAYIWYKQQQ